MEINKIHHMECLQGLRQLKEDSVDLIVTDPPYFIENLKEDLSEQTLRKSSKNNIFHNEFDHFENKEAFQNFIKEVLQECNRVLKPKGQIYMFFSYHHIDWAMLYIKEHFRFYKPLIWYKPDTMGVFPNQYGCNFEVILWFRKHANRKGDDQYEAKLNIGNSQRDVFTYKSTLQAYRAECGFHPTPKPIGLIRTLIKNGSNEGDLILDPFMGSGTTAVASKQIGRNFIGFELNEEYVMIGEKRLKQSNLSSVMSLTNYLNTEEVDDAYVEVENEQASELQGDNIEQNPE